MRCLPLVVLTLFLCSCVMATPSTPNDKFPSLKYLPSLYGDYFDIDSSAVGRSFHIYVRLPQGYDADRTRTYPVVYLLDGDSLFPLLSPTHLFLTYDEKLSEAIIVGICYGGFDASVNKRDVDFSASGASHFLDFLKRELIPAVDRRYRVDANKRILLGQSRGADFVLWSASAEPSLFWGRIASSPDAILPSAGQIPSKEGELLVAVSYGTRDRDTRQRVAREWVESWSSGNDAPWNIKLFTIQDGTHAASVGEVYRQTMLWLFNSEIK